MKFLTITTKNLSTKKKRFNPHRIWTGVCIFFVIMVILELCYFSWYFVQTTEKLDAPVEAVFETSAGKIKSMQKTLDEVEMAIEARAGITVDTSRE